VKLSVFHTPEEVPDDATPDCAIAIDVLRATSTMAAALDAGAEAIIVVGGRHSANTRKLAALVEKESLPAYHVETAALAGVSCNALLDGAGKLGVPGGQPHSSRAAARGTRPDAAPERARARRPVGLVA